MQHFHNTARLRKESDLNMNNTVFVVKINKGCRLGEFGEREPRF
jgi:hypothetical protein